MYDLTKYLKRFFEKITDTTEFSDSMLRCISIILMFIAVILTCCTYQTDIEKSFLYFFSIQENIVVSIRPTLISIIISVLLLAPIVLRQNKLKISMYMIILCTLDILFTSSFISVFVSGEAWDIPLINISSSALLVFAICMTWCGMRSLGGIIWLSLFLMSIGRMTETSLAMGFWGCIYILSAIISILCQIKFTEHSILLALKRDFFGFQKQIATDCSSANDAVSNVLKDAVEKISQIQTR